MLMKKRTWLILLIAAVLLISLLFSGCMRLLGRVIQPLPNDDVPGIYTPTCRTATVISKAANGIYYNFPNGDVHSKGPYWGRMIFFGAYLPFTMVGDTLLLPFDTFKTIDFHLNPPYWFLIKKQDWKAFDAKTKAQDPPTPLDIQRAFEAAKGLPSLNVERFKALADLNPSYIPDWEGSYYATEKMPEKLLLYLLEGRKEPFSDSDILSYSDDDSLGNAGDRKLQILLEHGANPNAVDEHDLSKTILDRLLEKEASARGVRRKTQRESRIRLLKKHGAKTFKDLAQSQLAAKDGASDLRPIPVRVLPDRLDKRLRPILKNLQAQWKNRAPLEWYLFYPDCVPREIPALIVVQKKTLTPRFIFEIRPDGHWSEKPERKYLIPAGDMWYLVITPKGVLLPRNPSPLPTSIPEIRHIPLENCELWFCGEIAWKDDFSALLRVFPVQKSDFVSTYPKGKYRYDANADRSLFPPVLKNPPRLASYRRASENLQLPGTWNEYLVNYGTPCRVGVLEYHTRKFGNLHGVDTDGYMVIVYPPVLHQNAAADLPCAPCKRGYWNEVGPTNKHGLKVSILYGDNVPPKTLDALIALAENLQPLQ